MYKLPPSYAIEDAPGSHTVLDIIREYKKGPASFTLFA